MPSSQILAKITDGHTTKQPWPCGHLRCQSDTESLLWGKHCLLYNTACWTITADLIKQIVHAANMGTEYSLTWTKVLACYINSLMPSIASTWTHWTENGTLLSQNQQLYSTSEIKKKKALFGDWQNTKVSYTTQVRGHLNHRK